MVANACDELMDPSQFLGFMADSEPAPEQNQYRECKEESDVTIRNRSRSCLKNSSSLSSSLPSLILSPVRKRRVSGSTDNQGHQIEEEIKVVPLQEVPSWLKNNDYLLHGHRPPLNSFRSCIRSIFHLHNETGNIWTHLLGCVMFAFLQAYFYFNAPASMTQKDLMVFSCFFSSAVICLALSTSYHTFYCHSEPVGNIVKRLDYCGITLLIVGSFMPWLYYGFYCDYYSKRIYMAMIIGLGLLTMTVSLCEKFSEPDLRGLRAGVFIVFGLSGLLPSAHWVYAYGNPAHVDPELQLSIACLGLMAATYITGALFYAFRIPERFMPGKCDIWFHSHQIFHVFVIIAAFIQYFGTTHMALYRLTHNRICPVNQGADILLPKSLPVSLPINPFLGDSIKMAMITPHHSAMSL